MSKSISHSASLKVYAVFSLSGATALIYQVLWARWLGLVFGNTTSSISIVLGSFMLGLALGSWAAGKALHRIKNPMIAYALMELGIGAFALLFPMLTQATQWGFTVLVSAETPETYSLFIRATMSIILLMLPTTLMGATLPLLTDFFRRNPRHTSTWKVGVLYAANTFGAAIGVLAASFVLIEAVGVLGTTQIAASLNLCVALLAYIIAQSSRLEPAGVSSTVKAKQSATGKIAMAVLAASGATAMASEVLWTRTIETMMGNSTYAFATIVLLYLLGIAGGSWFMSLIVNRLKQLPLWLVSLQGLMGVWIYAALGLFEMNIDFMYKYRGTEVSVLVIIGLFIKTISILLPLAFLSGACFPLATRIIDPGDSEARGELIADAYALNTIGAVVGSLAAGFAIAPFADYFQSLYLLAAMYGLTAFSAFLAIGIMTSTGFRLKMSTAIGILCLALLVTSLIETKNPSRFVKRFDSMNKGYTVAFHEPGVQGVTSVLRPINQPLGITLLVNGKGMTRKITDTKIMAHLPMLLHPNPKDTLIICFGMGTTYRSAVSYGRNVTVVELVSQVYETFGLFYQDAPEKLAYPRGRLVVNDGRNFLNLTRDRYDVITIDPPPPIDMAGITNLYSREFLELAKSRLKEGGIMAHWIPLPGSMAGVDDEDTMILLLNTFASAFPYTYVIPSYSNVGLHVLGSMEPIHPERKQILANIAKPGVAGDLHEWDDIPNDFFMNPTVLEKGRRGFRMNTDDRPALEFYLLRALRTGSIKAFPVFYW